jgi:DNA repair protein RecN (Recombination protein N)
MEISKKHQILCITHLPQIAAAGDHNYKILKKTINDATYTTIEALNEKQKIEEISRLLGGINITSATIKSAEEMIHYSNKQSQIVHQTQRVGTPRLFFYAYISTIFKTPSLI